MLSYIPLRRRILRLLRFWKKPSREELSEKSWVIAPPGRYRAKPAIFVEGEFDKVIADTRKERARTLHNFDKAAGEWLHATPTVAYLFKSAYLADGFLYKGALKVPFLEKRESLVVSNDFERIDHAVLASQILVDKYFAHLIVDELPLNLAAQRLGQPVVPEREQYVHEPEYRHLFNLHPRQVKQAKFDELILIEDAFWNDDKAERFEQLRAQLRRQMSPSSPVGAFFRRGSSGHARVLINEPEVEAFLESQGFVILDPQNSSATELLTQSLDAGIVAGVEGSQMAPGFLSVKNRGTVLTLQPPRRFNIFCKGLMDSLDLTYSFVVGDPAEQGFRIDIDRLARTLDLITQKANVII